MKFENENILSIVALCAFVVLVLAIAICVIAGNVKAALIIFVPTMVCGLVSNAFGNEYEIVEYYYWGDEELD